MQKPLCDYTPELRLYYDRSKENSAAFWQAVLIIVLKPLLTKHPAPEVQATDSCDDFNVTPVTWPGYQVLHVELKSEKSKEVVEFVRRTYFSSPPTRKTWTLITRDLGARLFFCTSEDWVPQGVGSSYTDAGDISSFALVQALRAIVEEVATPRLNDVVVLFRCTTSNPKFDIHKINARHLIDVPTGIAKWSSTHSTGEVHDRITQYEDSAVPPTFALNFSRNRPGTRKGWVFGSSPNLHECDVQLDMNVDRAVSKSLFVVYLHGTGTPYIRALARQDVLYRSVPAQLGADGDVKSFQGRLWSGLPTNAHIDITGRLFISRGPVQIMFWCPLRSFEDSLQYSKKVKAFRASAVGSDNTKVADNGFALQLEPDGTTTPLLRFSRKTGASYKTVDHARRTGAKGSTASVGCVLEISCQMTFALKTPYPTPDPALRQRRNEGLCLEYQALTRLKYVCGALDFLFRHNIIHRDIKPKNLLTRRTSETHVVKLSDFGSCRRIGGEHLKSLEDMTPVYRAPETCFVPVKYDHAVDLWALGIVLAQCVMGYNPEGERFWVEWSEMYPGFVQEPAKLLWWSRILVKRVHSRCTSPYKPLLVGLLLEDPASRWTASKTLDWLSAKTNGGNILEATQTQEVGSSEHVPAFTASYEDGLSPPPSQIAFSLPDTQYVTET
ncbi:hypothetical protein LTR95_014888 [Oleoguttula sp. CCFEE 5521]